MGVKGGRCKVGGRWAGKREGQSFACPSNPPWSTDSITSQLIVIDLCALELVGIVDVNRLPFREEIDGSNGGFAVAVAGLLRAPEGQVGLGADRRRVHVDNSGVEITGSLKGTIHVSRVDLGGRRIIKKKSHINGLVEAVNRGNRKNWDKNRIIRNT